MQMKPSVRVEALSKQYVLGSCGSAYATLPESVVEGARTPVQWLRGQNGRDKRQTIWELPDLNFEVAPGAGKSTLLIVLSRITQPRTGRAELFGRVASLLEVGTGFHPELTGRKNIYLNGAVLGMQHVFSQHARPPEARHKLQVTRTAIAKAVAFGARRLIVFLTPGFDGPTGG